MSLPRQRRNNSPSWIGRLKPTSSAILKSVLPQEKTRVGWVIPCARICRGSVEIRDTPLFSVAKPFPPRYNDVMPRIARIIAPGYPHHITQRGNNRATVFFDDEDRQTYLKLLSGYAHKHSLQIWAYCLMDNHIHLLAVPETETALARGIGLTNQVYTQYLNRKLNQSGRVWQNRFFSCVVGSEQYLWAVARYIERNPLKVGLAERADDYQWSSAKAHLTETNDTVLHTTTWLPQSERAAYSEFVLAENDGMDDAIRKATRTGRPFGSENFIEKLELQLNQALKPQKVGRPRKKIGGCP